MATPKLTIFQKLSRMLGPDGIKNKPTQVPQRYSMGKDVLFKTTDKKEFEIKKLEAQQNMYLSKQWKKVDQGLFQQSLNYETTRIASYSDFEYMEFFPEIAAALDIMMEESTTLNNNGRMINVYSDSKRVKGIIEDLLFNRLDAHTALPMWTRNTAKYGDNFVYLQIDGKSGIIGAKQMPNYEMERRDGGLYNVMGYKQPTDGSEDKYDTVKFFWRGQDIEFNNWQIAHFRLFGDDRKLPYGTSMLEKARRIWKQLQLAEDAMLVYRVTRAPERRIYKVYVGNMNDEDIHPYVQDFANRFKRTSMVDPQTGQVDLRHNQLANDQDYFVPVRTEDAPNPIDTLPGAANLDQIADIEHLQKKLFTALRVPKPFLGFEEATGDGKNLALQDVRFSRTVNRIQQAMLQELNKIIVIHLSLLGFQDELDNFTITMNNPSTQAEMLKIEHLQTKITLYKDSVSDAGNGFGAMSMTRAKREILGWADNDIKQDLLEQRMEKAAAAELANSASVIKHTGLFDTVDRIYGDMKLALKGGVPEGGEGGEGGAAGGGGGGMGGGFGGGGTAENDLDFGDEGGASGGTETGGVEPAGGLGGAEGGTEAGAEPAGNAPTPEPTAEAIKKVMAILAEERYNLAGYGQASGTTSEALSKVVRILAEERDRLSNKLTHRADKFSGRFLNKLVQSVDGEEKTLEHIKIYDKNVRITEGAGNIVNEINNMLDESKDMLDES